MEQERGLRNAADAADAPPASLLTLPTPPLCLPPCHVTTRTQAVVARLEACMRALGLSLSPPPPVDLDSVPLERLLPLRTPRAGGLAGTLASHQVLRGAG